jgi:hypothetical protein
MKTSLIRTGSSLPGILLAFVTTAFLVVAVPVPVRAATEVLHTFLENFNALNSNADGSVKLSGQNGWTSDGNDTNAAVIPAGTGNNVLKITENKWAAHAISQNYASEADRIVFSWTEQAISGKNLVAGGALVSGTNAWDASLLSISMARSATTSWVSTLQYTSWNGSSYATITVPRSGDDNPFAPGNSITYSFVVDVDLAAHTYSFTISNASTNSIVWSSPAAIGINPDLAFPKWVKLQVSGGTDGGGVFDDVVLQQLKTVSDPAVPEPATWTAIAGVVLLAFAIMRRHR